MEYISKSNKRLAAFTGVIYLIMIGLCCYGLSLRGINNMVPIYVFNVAMELFAMATGYVLFICCLIDVQKTGSSQRYFLYMLNVGIVSLFTDAMAWILEGVEQLWKLNYIDNFILFLCGPLAAFCFWKYIGNALVFSKPFEHILDKVVSYGLAVPVIMRIINLFNGMYFTVLQFGIYKRGPLYALSNVYALLVLIAVAVVVKILLGRYVKNVGEDINSQALVASGSDALFDAVLSLSTLIAAIISIFYHISLEGILGVIISFVIIKASIDMLRETLDSMIGARVDSELSQKIKASIREIPGVYGAYDLSLHNYGPEDMQGSVHVEIDDTLTALDIHKLTREIQTKIYQEFSIALTVGIYARNDKFKEVRDDLYNIASEYEEVIEIHGFIVLESQNIVMFDIIVDFDADREKVKNEILDKIKSKHPQFEYQMIDDYDVSD